MGEKKTTIGEGLGFYKEYVVGMMAGVVTVVVGHSFDTVKVKLMKHNTEVQGQEHHFWTAGKDIDEAIIVDEKTDKVIGASMCGPDAAEIMQGIAIALKCGAAKAQFDSTVGIHPSSAEEFLTMRSVTRRIAYKPKPKTNL